MAIRVTVSGTVYEADTAAEIVELQRLLSPKQQNQQEQVVVAGKKAGRPSSVQPSENGASTDYKTFANTLNANGRAVVAVLVQGYPERVSTSELARKSSISPMSLPPIFKHIRSTAAKANLNPDTMIVRKQIVTDGHVFSMYHIEEQAAKKLLNFFRNDQGQSHGHP